MYDSCYWLQESCDELEDGFPEKLKENLINSLLFLSFSYHFGNLVFGCFWQGSYQNIM